MKEIQIANSNKVALVDDEDHEFLSKFRWRLLGWAQSYAVTGSGIATVLMHRMIMGLEKFDGKQIDHRDGNELNNQKNNLLICSQSQNNARTSRAPGSSGFRGVTWDKERRKYQARINFEGKFFNLGRFDDPKEAAHVRDDAARELHGEFAVLNFPPNK